MREVVKKYYVIERMNDYSDEWMWSFNTYEEAVKFARHIWDYQTDKEKQAKTIYVVQFDSVQKDDGEWTPITEDDEEYKEGMSYVGAYDVAYEISSYGESNLSTFDE